MANMSYCRFENTSKDLADCFYALKDEGFEGLSESERLYADEMYVLCKRFIKEYEWYKDEEEEVEDDE